MAGFVRFLHRVKEPAAGPIFASVDNGAFFSERLKAVLRIRVMKTNSPAKGGLAIENVRVISLGVGFHLVCKRYIGELARAETESGRPLEVKRHFTFRNIFSTHQLGRLVCHQDRFNSVADIPPSL
jgi:hypothetical protein